MLVENVYRDVLEIQFYGHHTIAQIFFFLIKTISFLLNIKMQVENVSKYFLLQYNSNFLNNIEQMLNA